MYCHNCGQEILVQGKFCHNCGIRLEDMVEAQEITEICEIVFSVNPDAGIFRYPTVYFWAQVTSPLGTTSAGWKSKSLSSDYNSVYHHYYPKQTREAQEELSKLRTKLMADGWEEVGKQERPFWAYSYKRKRRIPVKLD